MFFSCKYAALALPIRAFSSASDPPCLSMMLPRYVNVFTSSKPSPSSVIRLLHAVLYRRISLSPLCMLESTAAEAAAKLVVFSCICYCVCDGEPDYLQSLVRSAAFQLSTVSHTSSQIECGVSLQSASAFSASAGMLSGSATLPLLIRLMAMLISSIVGGPTSIGRSVAAASMSSGFSGDS
ncbi:unnamed protein product [Schistosoma mattheei]|uniref:Uncharacterized protein n=1 Tax=Schistosoma mattheei TaxID=31246 RepID=A0A183PJC1_9TREM|nr:unnamed protein product [Schistosoma mattheei]